MEKCGFIGIQGITKAFLSQRTQRIRNINISGNTNDLIMKRNNAHA